MNEDSLGHDLLMYLHERVLDDPGVPRAWRMNLEWWREVRGLSDAMGSPLIELPPDWRSPLYLLGFQIEVTEEATVPVLVPVEEATQ